MTILYFKNILYFQVFKNDLSNLLFKVLLNSTSHFQCKYNRHQKELKNCLQVQNISLITAHSKIKHVN